MIITRTPLRISLVGGGTDVPAFYTQNFGAVVSFAIDKYVYAAVNRKFDKRTRVSYSVTEEVDQPGELKHELVKQAMGHFRINGGVEVVTVSDIPGEGSGLGSSSALMVGLVTAFRKWKKLPLNVHPTVFAEEAYYIERMRCGHLVGKQDHFASAYGGLRYYRFDENEDVIIRHIPMTTQQARFLETDLMLFYTGTTRKANPILENLELNLRRDEVTQNLGVQLRDMAGELCESLLNGHFEGIGSVLHEGWMLKKRMAQGVSDSTLDAIYETAMRAGASGGKVLGAGGGGFMLFAGGWDHWRDIERALEPLKRVHFKIDMEGSKVIYRGDEHG